MKSKTIIIPTTIIELDAYYKLRYEVLRKPWGQAEDSTKDEWEDISIHVLMLNKNGEAIAAGRLQLNPGSEGQIRSMAVKEEYRGQGLGSEILLFLEEKADQHPYLLVQELSIAHSRFLGYPQHSPESNACQFLAFHLA